MIPSIRPARAIPGVEKRVRHSHNTSYANRKWMAASEAFVRASPWCVLCLAYGGVNYGAEEYQSRKQRNLIVDHIIPHRGDSELFWCEDNWQVLCRYPCHDSEKSSVERNGRDWWEHVRSVIAERRTQAFVAEWVDRLPPHVAGCLGIATG